MDELRRAYAVLEMEQGAPLHAVRARYILLAKRWHPDRFASDPIAEAAAGERMRSINVAYDSLLKALGGPAGARHPTPPSVGRRLSREEIERMVRSMQAESAPGSTLSSAVGDLGISFLALLALRAIYMIVTGPFAQLFRFLRQEPVAALAIASLLVVAIRECLSPLLTRHSR